MRRLGVEGGAELARLQDVDHLRRDASGDEDAAGGLEGQGEVAGEAPEQAREHLQRILREVVALAASEEDVVRRAEGVRLVSAAGQRRGEPENARARTGASRR